MKSFFLSFFTLVICLGFLPIQAEEPAPQKQPLPLTAKEAAQKKLVEDAKDKVAKHPEDAEAHFELARAYYLAEDAEAGLKAVDVAIKLNPNVAKYHAKRAIFLSFTLEGLDESAKAWDEALKLEPNNANFWFDRATYHPSWWVIELDQETEALPNLEKVLAINPKHVSALAYAGQIYLLEKKFAQAKAAFQKALEIDRQNQPLANKFANQGLLEPEDEVTWEEQALFLGGPGGRQPVMAGLIQIFELEGNTTERDAYLARIYANNQGPSDNSFCREKFEMEIRSFETTEAFVNDSPTVPKYNFEGTSKNGATERFRLIAVPIPKAADQPENAPQKYRYEFQSYRRGIVFVWSKIYKRFDKQPSYQEVKALLNEVLLGKVPRIYRDQAAVK